jgi:glycosyl hydrolase family 6
MNRLRQTLLLALAALSLTAVLPSASFADGTDPTNPLRARHLFMDCDASHQSSARKYNPWYAVRHNPSKANALRKIAQVPGTKWFAGIQERPTRYVERFFANVDDPQWGGPNCSTRLARGARDSYVGDYPVVAIRRLVNGSCAGMQKVGNEYKAWIDEFIRMSQLTFVPDAGERYQYWMGSPFPRGHWVKATNRQMTIILEPDALGLMGARRSCVKRTKVASRLALLKYAAMRLGSTPGMNVYIDAGSSSWLSRRKTGSYLRRAGVAYTRGFALNSTHFNRTSHERSYGNALARHLGKHYVVNTAENGNGSLPKSKWGKYGSAATTCNPRNAGLGNLPTTATGSAYADAFLWVSRPGLSSNGKAGNPQCGKKGGPAGNVFYVKQAVRLARQAKFSKAVWPPLPL